MGCSNVENKLAESQKRFKETVASEYIIPLRAFLEVDIKAVLVSFLYYIYGALRHHIVVQCDYPCVVY